MLNAGEVKQWRTLGVLALVVSAAVLVWVCRPRQREPVYQGKKLSEWLLISRRFGRGADQKREESVRAIGSNAVPFLLIWIQYEMEPWRRALVGFSPRFKFLSRRQELAEASREGFRILGWEAEPAIPELVRLMKGTNLTFATRALWSMEAMGSAGLPVLLDVVTNRPAYIRYKRFYPSFSRPARYDAGPVVPVLLQSLKNKDPAVAATAAMALEGIGPEIGVVKALTNVVAEATDSDVKLWAVHSLGRMGADSIPAVPCLTRALNDSDGDVRQEATNALRRLSSQTMGVVKAP